MKYIVKIAIAGACSTVVGVAITQPSLAQQQSTNPPSTTTPSGQPGTGPAMGQQMMQRGMDKEHQGQSMQRMGQGMAKDGRAMEGEEHGHMGQAAQNGSASAPVQSNSSAPPK